MFKLEMLANECILLIEFILII